MANGVTLAVRDLRDGLRLSPLWLRLGWEQTINRFRRTLLGPFWLATGMLATAFALAFVFGGLSGSNYRESFPFIIAGILCWSVVGAPVTEGAGVFMGAAGLMQQQRLPLSFHVFLSMQRVFVNFLAQLIAFWLVLLCFRLASIPTWQFLPGLAVVLINGFLTGFIVGIPSTRFRDVSFMIGFVMQILFFVTPIFWTPGSMPPGPRRNMVIYNPFAHMLELVRQPLLGKAPEMQHWMWGLGWMAFLAVVSIILLSLYRKRIVFWL